MVEGFDEAWMKEAFVRPKVYVLVDDDPRDDDEPVVDADAPTEVEPVVEDGAAETPENDSAEAGPEGVGEVESEAEAEAEAEVESEDPETRE